MTPDEFYLHARAACPNTSVSTGTYLQVIEDASIPVFTYTSAQASNFPEQLSIIQRALVSHGLFTEDDYLAVTAATTLPSGDRKLILSKILTKLARDVNTEHKTCNEIIIGKLQEAFGQSDLATFFNESNEVVRAKIEAFFEDQGLLRTARNVTRLPMASTATSTLTQSADKNKKAAALVATATPSDASSCKKRKGDRADGDANKKPTYPSEFCNVCGNFHPLTDPCTKRIHPDANNDPKVRWEDSAAGKIYVGELGKSYKDEASRRFFNRGIQWHVLLEEFV